MGGDMMYIRREDWNVFRLSLPPASLQTEPVTAGGVGANAVRVLNCALELCDNTLQGEANRYRELLRALISDQLAWVNDPTHQRKVTEQNGLDFRHTFLTRLREAGTSLEAEQARAGHRSIESTRIYLHPADGWLADEYRRAHDRIDTDGFAPQITERGDNGGFRS